MAAPIPLTVVGGYLGAGKTTVLNHLLQHPGGRRLAAIVNDFGEVGIDARLLATSAGPDALIDLPNGCVCCTLADGLQQALGRLAELDPPVDHIVVEASGVADPAAIAAWAYTPGHAPGGVVVAVAADAVERQRDDRMIGPTVRRQLAAADLVLLTRSDVVETDPSVVRADTDAPVLVVDHGRVDPAVVLGLEAATPSASPRGEHAAHHRAGWQHDRPRARSDLDRFLADLAPGILRLKGWVALDDGSAVEVQVVGRSTVVRPLADPPPGSQLVAIWLDDDVAVDWRALDG